MIEAVECVVVGAGVVGLAIARGLAEAGREVVVLEQHGGIGEETSSRNSEVIHAGLYYPTGSLKARLCVSGKKALYDYCESRSIAHSRCGKLVFAVDDAQTARLASIAEQARQNGVSDLQWRKPDEIRALEPALKAVAGLWSPSTGIVDSHGLMLAMQGDIESAGGMVSLRSQLVAGRLDAEGIHIEVQGEDEQIELVTATLINAAGLYASHVANLVDPELAASLPPTRYAKGNYFQYRGGNPLSHLLYPLPVDGGLGIHATVDLAGGLRFGPDVEWVDSLDYTVDASRAAAFYDAIRTYWPELPDGSLSPAYSGIRAKVTGPGEGWGDFVIVHERASARADCVHLIGIESPGLTAALAIGEHVRSLLEAQ